MISIIEIAEYVSAGICIAAAVGAAVRRARSAWSANRSHHRQPGEDPAVGQAGEARWVTEVLGRLSPGTVVQYRAVDGSTLTIWCAPLFPAGGEGDRR
jgi:hypothetical protein